MYHLFCGQNYYPQSGLGDYVASFETPEEAEEAGKEKTAYDPNTYHLTDDWYVVITEADGGLIEYASGYKPHG